MVQFSFGLALDRFEEARLNVAFVTPPELEVPATPNNLKYLYFLPACRLLVSTKVAGGGLADEAIAAVFKLSHNTLSAEPWNLNVLAASKDIGLKSKSKVKLVISIRPLAVYFKISLPAKNCPDLNAAYVASDASIDLSTS